MHYLRNEYKVFCLTVTFHLMDYMHVGYIFAENQREHNIADVDADPRFEMADLAQIALNQLLRWTSLYMLFYQQKKTAEK